MTNLPVLLAETGLLQFGYFEVGKPYKLLLDLLPSYPHVLDELVNEANPMVGQVDHLVSTLDAIPLGIGLSLRNHIPLVTSRGHSTAPVHNLVGAYDIGHPALLLANQPTANLRQLISDALTVGLDIQSIVVLVDDGAWRPDLQAFHSLIKLSSAVETLVEQRFIPAEQGVAVQSWINHHPNSGAP